MIKNIYIAGVHEMIPTDKMFQSDMVLRINTSNQSFQIVKNRYGASFENDWLPFNLLSVVLACPDGILLRTIKYNWYGV